MDESLYDFAVLGLGAMGAATLLRLAESGARVVGLDRRRPPHVFGSTHGETRITRRAVGEGFAYAPLAIRSHEIWREIEEKTGEKLLQEVGCLILSRPDDAAEGGGRAGFLRRTRAAAERFGIAHEILSATEIRARFPQFAPQGGEVGYFEPGGGHLNPEACVAAQLRLARAAGAEIRFDLQALSLGRDGGGLRIETAQGPIRAKRLALSAGAGAGGLLGPPFEGLLRPTRQVMHWYAPKPDWEAIWASGPVFIWTHGAAEEDFFYGFPGLGGAVKVADEAYGPAVDPDLVDREVPETASQAFYERHLAPRIRGLTRLRAKAATCLYTSAPENAFLIDWSPQDSDVLILSPCSGHGFKHSAAIGEAAAQLLTSGVSALDLSAFSLAGLLERQA